MFARNHTAGRLALAPIVIAAAVALGACGGGSSNKSGGGPSLGGTNPRTTTSPVGGGGGSNCPSGNKHARVRFVNLYTNATYAKGDIEIWQGYSRTGCSKRLATVSYGTASDYVDVTSDDDAGDWAATAYVPGGADQDHTIIQQTETWKGGEQITMLVFAQTASSTNTAAAGADQTLYEKDPAQPTSISTAPGKATIVASATALQPNVPDGSWRLGVPGSGCLSSVEDSTDVHTNVGGTTALQFAVDPGTLQVGLWPSDPGTCAGTPQIGPVTVDATEGSRTLVLAYGADAQSLALLVLPFGA